MINKYIDLNSDLGESFGPYVLGDDEGMLEIVSSANIACGYHAGDHHIMAKTIEHAKHKQVSIGAHPGLPDLMGFGRRAMRIDPQEIYEMVLYQLGATSAFAKVSGITLQHVKPHGALYNMANVDNELARAIVQAIADFDKNLILFAIVGTQLYEAGVQKGLTVAKEIFADRTYQADGTLTPRNHKDAMIETEEVAVEQVLTILNEGYAWATDGTKVSMLADTICVHGDHEQSVQLAFRLREKLMEDGYAIRSFQDERYSR